jgi:S-adenosylmethionine synthetase
MVAIDEQSPDIAQGVDESYEAQHGDTGPDRPDRRGDQGMMFGLRERRDRRADAAPDHARAQAHARLAAGPQGGRPARTCVPDGKSQVTVRYEVDEHGSQRPGRDRARPHLDAAPRRPRRRVADQARPARARRRADPPRDYRDLFDPARLGRKDFLYVNPTGKFVIGGPMGDTG